MCSRTEQAEAGQATVEAAFALPVLCVLVLMLVQPGIVCYDRIVMKSAAAEACRLLATADGGEGASQQVCEDYVRRRLGAIPEQDNFHVHSSGCTWDIQFEGNEDSDQVRAVISTRVKPLPLIGLGLGLFGVTDGAGTFEVKVEVAQKTQPDWARSTDAGTDPGSWAGAWLS